MVYLTNTMKKIFDSVHSKLLVTNNFSRLLIAKQSLTTATQIIGHPSLTRDYYIFVYVYSQ